MTSAREVVLALGLTAFATAVAAASVDRVGDVPWSPGERFYLTGEGPDGGPVSAVVQGDLEVRSTDMPCANCHRRSGWAGAEGSVAVPPVAGPVLFAPVTQGGREMGMVRTTGQGTRPAYDESTLLRAIRHGVDAGGRVLSATMPRYALSEAGGAALVSYLKSLGAGQVDGVTASEIHLATITTPGVDAADREAVLSVLRAYVRDKNAGTRLETRRRERGPWDMKAHYENYRNWTLHVWELKGPSSGWPAQLEALYRAQPVFALVGGITDERWSAVHEFAERFRVPVILPQTPLPADGPAIAGFYTMYFSRGVALEADTLVERLSREPVSHVAQVSRCGTPGHSASLRVREALSAKATVTAVCVELPAPLGDGLEGDAIPAGAALVLWLGLEDVAAVAAVVPASVGAVYLSSTLVGADSVERVRPIGDHTLLLHPFVPPDDFTRHAWRALTWLKGRGLSPRSRQVAANALYAALLAAESLTHPGTLDSREYFIERIEAMAARSPNRSAYPETIFGTQRRFGSAGCYVLQVPASEGGPHRMVGQWTVPRS